MWRWRSEWRCRSKFKGSGGQQARVGVVSDPYHMRRLSWTWGKAFEGSGLQFTLVAILPAFWKPDAWWRDEKSGAAVIMEVIKRVFRTKVTAVSGRT